jgi:hypothetical protein
VAKLCRVAKPGVETSSLDQTANKVLVNSVAVLVTILFELQPALDRNTLGAPAGTIDM